MSTSRRPVLSIGVMIPCTPRVPQAPPSRDLRAIQGRARDAEGGSVGSPREALHVPPGRDADGARLGRAGRGRRGRASRGADTAAPLHRRRNGPRPRALSARGGGAPLAACHAALGQGLRRERRVRVRQPGGDSSGRARDRGTRRLGDRARRRARRARRARRRRGGLPRRAAARARARAAEGPRLRDRSRAVVHDARRGAGGALGAGDGRETRPGASAAASTGKQPGAFAAENTRLRVGDLLLAPADGGRGHPSGRGSRWTSTASGRLELDVEAA